VLGEEARTDEVRSRLGEAHLAVEQARSVLACIKAARERARDFAAEQMRAVEALAGEAHDIASERSDSIKVALRSGAIPMFPEAPALPANAAKMADAQGRLDAARIALEELQAEEVDAESEAAAAKDAYRQASEAVLVDEADRIAVRVEELESEALLLRARLGGPLSPAGQLRGMTQATQRVISSVDVAAFMRNPALEQEAQRALHVWRAFAEALADDAGAELSFEGPAADASQAA